MRQAMRLLLALTLSVLALPAQTTPSQLVFGTGAAPPPTSASTRVVGATGQQTLYYWVVARYPSGYSSPVGPASAFQTVGSANLSVTNYVAVSWSAMPQATGYDVLRSTTPTFPAPAGCVACAVALNTTGAAVNDTGGALSAWPAAGTSPAVPSQAVLNLDNISAAQPFVNVSLLSQKFSQVYKMVLVAGTPTAGNCAQWGSYGLLTDAGAACGTGSGGSSVAAGTGILVSTAGSPPTSTVSADSATVQFLSNAQAGTPLYCASASGSATTYTCALNPTLTAYTAGMTVAWKVDTSCTGSTATTLNIDSLGAKSIKEADGSTDPVSGDCPANRQVTLRYDGTLFRIVGGGAASSSTVTFTAGKGYISVVPSADPATNGPAYSSKVPRYFQFVVPPGISTPATKLVFFVSTAATAGACAGAADCGHAAALYDSSCNKISGSDFATNTVAIKSASIVTQTAATPVTLTGGVYYLGVASDSTALKVTSDNGNTSLSYILNASTDTRFATGANSATGDGATLAMPASCGALTATTGQNVPVFFIVP